METKQDYYNVFNVKEVLETLLENKTIIKATKFVLPNFIVRGVKTTYGGKIKQGNTEITLTIGKPNFAEREYIKKNKTQKFPYDYLLTKSLNPKKTKLKRNQ